MKKRSYINNESGIALVIALVMLLALTVIGISSMMTSTLDVQLSGNDRRSTEALNLADAGVQRGLHDLLYDFKHTIPASWTADDKLRTLSLIDGNRIGDPTDPGIPLGAPAISSFPGDWGDPFSQDWSTTVKTNEDDPAIASGDAVDPYGTQTIGDGQYRVFIMRASNKPDEIYARSYAEHNTGARKIIQLHLKMNTVDVWRNAIFAGRGAANAAITGNINVAGSVHVLGAGAVNEYTISGDAGLYNGYYGIGKWAGSDTNIDPTHLLDRINYDNLEVVGYSGGSPIYSLESEIRVKNTQVVVKGSGTIGETGTVDYNGDYWKGTVDGIYANQQVQGTSIYADNYVEGTHDDYDLGDKLQMPAFNDPYIDNSGTPWTTYKEYIESESLTIPPTYDHDSDPATDPVSLCSLKTADDSDPTPAFSFGLYNASGVCIDPKGCVTWDPGTSGSSGTPASLEIDGRIKFDTEFELDSEGNQIAGTGCSESEIVIGTAKGTIEYDGKGLIYTDKNIYMKGNFVTANSSSEYYIDDNLAGILTPGNIKIAEAGAGGDTHSVIMAGLFAGGLISTEMPSQIIGSLVSNEFCLGGTSTDAEGNTVCNTSGGGTASDIYYVPRMSDEITKLGMIRGRQIFTFTTYEWTLKYD